MPSPSPRSQMLRDDLLAQLRAANKPLTTRRLREFAAPIPVEGFTVRAAPLREHVYRALQQMRAENLVEPIPSCGRDLAWQLTTHGAARQEIDTLNAVFALPATPQPSMQPKDKP